MSDPAQDNQMNSGVGPAMSDQDWGQGGPAQDGVNQQSGGWSAGQGQQDDGFGGQQSISGGVGQTEQLVGRLTKEVEPVRQAQGEPIKSGQGEAINIVEMDRQRELGEVDAEVEKYVKEEKKENLKLDEKVVQNGKVLVGPSEPVDMPQVVLPMTKQSFLVNVHGPVRKSATWLAVFCKRLISKFRGRAVYSPAEGQ